LLGGGGDERTKVSQEANLDIYIGGGSVATGNFAAALGALSGFSLS
jgi:hypothetical protein